MFDSTLNSQFLWLSSDDITQKRNKSLPSICWMHGRKMFKITQKATKYRFAWALPTVFLFSFEFDRKKIDEKTCNEQCISELCGCQPNNAMRPFPVAFYLPGFAGLSRWTTSKILPFSMNIHIIAAIIASDLHKMYYNHLNPWKHLEHKLFVRVCVRGCGYGRSCVWAY